MAPSIRQRDHFGSEVDVPAPWSAEVSSAFVDRVYAKLAVVYAPYMISVVPDPLPVVREMRRVCRAGGTIVILNHFRNGNPIIAFLERAISPLTVHVGFKSDLDLFALLAQVPLIPRSIEKV